ncbi:MAG: DNA-3-methyladenine glycosylase [Frankiales bacterium]|nr:DNA-3-methyladenine glycosylase [Frankiales bacterium]MDX6213702.1 DNA-3-methyladenine glycosylase [Frankiales bacterium]
MRPWPRQCYARPVLEVARALLGQHLVRVTDEGTVVLRLTEVEAYGGADDPGSHSFRGRTPRNAVMFGPAGHSYVYFTYGMHHCVNVVTGREGEASAVLLRAGEVVAGEDLVRARRGAVAFRDLARGPARLTVALGIDRGQDGLDLTDPVAGLFVAAAEEAVDGMIETGPRVGVSGDGALRHWRFWLRDEPTVSPYRAAAPRPPRA